MAEETTIIPQTANADETTITTNGSGQLQALGVVPIGAVIPWLKTLTGVPSLPSNFVECDGSTIDDEDSPLDGQTVPDLNGNNNFLRGNSTSGGTGGSLTHNHQWWQPGGDAGSSWASNGTTTQAMLADTNDASSTLRVWDSENDSNAKYTKNTSNVPPYMDVVFVVRIK